MTTTRQRADFYLWYGPSECMRPRDAIITETLQRWQEGDTIDMLATDYGVCGNTIRQRIVCAMVLASRRGVTLAHGGN